MGHTDERFVSNGGFGVGEYGNVTNVISSAGEIELTGAVPASALAEEAGFESTITLYAATGALAIGQPVYISGYASTPGVKASLSIASDSLKAAQFIVTSDASSADDPVTVAPVADVAYNSTIDAGLVLYLTTVAGTLSTSVPGTNGHFQQAVGVVTKKSTTAGTAKMYPGYSKAVTVSS